MKTYYDILEVSKTASPEVIKRAHNVLIKKYHPDLSDENEKKEAENKTREINEAYEVLKDPAKREKYDNFLKNQEILNNKEKPEEKNRTSYNKQNEENMEIELANKKLNDEIEKRVNKAQEDINKEQDRIRNQMEQDYENYLRSMGYKVKGDTKTEIKKKLKKILIQLAFLLTVFIILSIIYKTKINEKMLELEKNNFPLKVLGNISRAVINIFWNMFKK